MPHSSSKRYQSALFLARRETSRPRTIPTWASATSLVRRANPERLSVVEPDKPQIFIDDDHLLFGPTELRGPIRQGVLAGGRFAVMLDLAGRGLANVNVGRALGVRQA